MTTPLTREQLLSLPVTTDLVTTGKALGVSEPTVRQMYRSGQLERTGVRVFRVGQKIRVVTSSLQAALLVPGHASAPGGKVAEGQEGHNTPGGTDRTGTNRNGEVS
jgi:hypothetical protein